MVEQPQVMHAQVMHKRTAPKVNQFTYGVYYLMLPVRALEDMKRWRLFGINRFNLLSFYDRDHGARDGSDCRQWARNMLESYGVDHHAMSIWLVTMPRVLGYVFNPVSFWMCVDEDEKLRAVIAEVNNTFGETHSYLLLPENGGEFSADDWIEADKQFHVSPFLQVEGFYRFRFAWQKEKLGIWIDYHTEEYGRTLLTSVVGKRKSLTQRRLWQSFWQVPLVSIKVIVLIHWQALRLWWKGVKHFPKPDAPEAGVTKWPS